MLTHVDWCTSVALCLDAQLAVSKADPMLRNLLHRVPLAGNEQKRRVPAQAKCGDSFPQLSVERSSTLMAAKPLV